MNAPVGSPADSPVDSPLVRHEFALLESLRDEPTLRLIAAVVLLMLAAGAVWWYWRERSAVSAPIASVCGLLRLVALAAVMVMVLGPQRRAAETQTRPSRVVVLVDTSLSMTLPAGQAATGVSTRSRSDLVLRGFAESSLLADLAEQHEVVVRATSGAGRWSYTPPRPADDGGRPATGTIDIDADDWRDGFAPYATETRLGDAIAGVVEEHAGRPLAGVVLVTDGQSNRGREPLAVAGALLERGAVLHTLGVGPESPGVNLAVRDVLAPAVAYPGDELSITAVIESSGRVSGVGGVPGADVRASLFRRREEEPADRAELVDTQQVAIGTGVGGLEEQPAGRVTGQATLKFGVSPGGVGRYVYTVRLPTLSGELNVDDNTRGATVEVVDRVLKVLLLAGGPSRDYRFLRDQLRRDDSFEVDVLLQSAGAGVLQDAANTLDAFPDTDDKLSEYDVVLAFDPDWRVIADGERRLEQAVSDRGSGLLYVPGPVHTPRWLGSRDPSRVKAMLPVVMPDRWLALSTSVGVSRRRSPVQLTPAGAEADFLWIAGSRQASLELWRDFAGFYRCFPAQSVKPGATVYARMDPATGGDAALSGATGVLLAEQFYGAGRVMVLSSSELWRLRSIDPSCFTTLTTKLLQHLAQGRLSAKVPGGSLLFERTRCRVGDTMVLRATAVNADPNEPLEAEIVDPGGGVRLVPLLPSESQPGSWTARWAANAAGRVYAIVRPAVGRELTASIEVSVPALERGSVVRDVALLGQLASAGGGNYYPTFDAATAGLDGLPALAAATPSRAETTVVFGRPDPRFIQLVSRWALGLIAGCLIVEWLVRRLNYLA